MDDQNKNLILATALSFLVILVWFLLFPPAEQAPTPRNAAAAVRQALDPGEPAPPCPPVTADATPRPAAPRRSPSPRTCRASRSRRRGCPGSISLRGGRIDDL